MRLETRIPFLERVDAQILGVALGLAAGPSRGETLDAVPGERLAPRGQMRAVDPLPPKHRLDVATRDAGIGRAHDA